MEESYYMPAEWAAHQACWMAWPCAEEVWQDIGLHRARRAYAQVAHAIAEFEPVKVLVRPQDKSEASQILHSSIELIEFDLADSWLRDTGPSFLINANGAYAGIDWRHNAYGKYYKDYLLDDKIAAFILKRLNYPCFSTDFVMEGGSFHVDGEGTVLTTAECLLHPNRNPELSIDDLEERLKHYLGAKHIIWLPHGLVGDETNGHVDEVACFIAPGHVLALVCRDPNDENYARLQENLAVLKGARDAKARPLQIHTIEMPPAYYLAKRRLTLSYINFYRANKGIVMPAFGFPEYDDAAVALFEQLFPEQKIVSVNALDIFAGGGGIHCITQQQPYHLANRS